ncbi:uncharacterized protein LOC108114504 [Drosophila eugracilis]|uniref:uncharacterized protein LOC108114504 n=1 Tax=Drosophila eugracilis TaxID=29029 RepID=UPI0007E88F8B|nr:uncharacterized protein LOC108114504 [Drosophila eugracilis]
MAKLIIFFFFLWTHKSLALPIIDIDILDDPLMEVCPPCLDNLPTCSNWIVEVESGNGLPGSCCPRYECHDEKPVCNGFKMRFYKNRCTVCDPCAPLAIQCKEICPMDELIPNCLTDNNEYKQNGDVWLENNGCTTCTCLDGIVSRTSIQCNHKYACSNPFPVKGKCCLVCPEELDDSELTMGGTTRGPEMIGRNDTTEEITIKYITSTPTSEITTPIPFTNESSSLPTPIESSSAIPDTSESFSSTDKTTSSTEIFTSTPDTSESTSAVSSSESPEEIASSESPDLRIVTEINETSSSDSPPTETAKTPTTDVETFTDSITTIDELETSTDDRNTKGDYNTESTSVGINDVSTEIVLIDNNSSVMTDSPITNKPEAVPPESTSQVKEFNDTTVLHITSTNHYADVPQEQIKTDSTWIYVIIFLIFFAVGAIFLFIRVCKNRNHFESKKNQADSTAAATPQSRESVALLNPVRK